MDYTMHTSTKCWITIPGIIADADMNVDALFEILRGSLGVPDVTLWIASSTGESETKTFKGMAGLLECCDFVKSNMHNNITLKVQEIKQVSALLDYRKS